MSFFRVSALTVVIGFAALSGCSNDRSEGPSADPATTAANAPTTGADDGVDADASSAERSTPEIGSSDSWAFVAGSIYAGAKACGSAEAELEAYKVKARQKVEALGAADGFDEAFAQGVAVAQEDGAGAVPDARTCELTRDALSRG